MMIDVQFEVVENEHGFIEFHESIDSALKRVSKTFGFNIKDMRAIHIPSEIGNDDGEHKWFETNGIWCEGYFQVNTMKYHFRYEYWDAFKPSLWTV